MLSKNNNALNSILLAMCVVMLSMFSACQNTDDLDELLETAGQTRATSTLKLEETTFCLLEDGEKVALPWVDGNETTIPEEICKDVKETDGWKVLFSNIELIDYPTKVTRGDMGQNYLLLYNRYRGILKGFFYLPKVESNNSARWLLTINSGTKLFNFASYFALAMDDPDSPNQISTSLVSNNGITQGFDEGWNCFMIELAYDDNSINEKLSISGYAYNTTTYKFNGSYKSASQGTIIAYTGSTIDPLGVASAFGNTAKKWVEDHTTGKDVSAPIKYKGNILANVLDKGISGFITSGLSRIFGSMLGTQRSVTDFQFTTNGSITLEGTSQTPKSGYVSPIGFLPLNGIGENLGVWNLETTPTWGFDANVPLKKISNAGSQETFTYIMKCTPSYKIKMNPALRGHIEQSVKYVRYERTPWYPEDWGMQLGKPFSLTYVSSFPVLYSDETTQIEEQPLTFDMAGPGLMPTRTIGSGTPAAYLPDSKFNIGDKVAIQVISPIYISSRVATSIKTFVPKTIFIQNEGRPYGWTKTELSSKGYYR